jgi:transposase
MRPAGRSSSASGARRALVRGKRWLLLRSWTHLDREDRQTLRELFALNRRLAKAYLLRDQLAQLWTYTYAGWARRFLTTWLRALRWQRLPAFQKLGRLLTRHRDGILNYCHEKVPFVARPAVGRDDLFPRGHRRRRRRAPGLPRLPHVAGPSGWPG